MNHNPYMARAEMLEYLKVGILAGEAENIAMTTERFDKKWAQKLRTAAKYCQNIITERLKYMSKEQVLTLSRRNKHTEMFLLTSDQKRIREDREEVSITVETDDLYDLLDLAMKSCLCCEQGEYCKSCRYRSMYHRLGVPPLRTNPKDGECEFRCDNDAMYITPQEQIVEMAKAARQVGADPSRIHRTQKF